MCTGSNPGVTVFCRNVDNHSFRDSLIDHLFFRHAPSGEAFGMWEIDHVGPVSDQITHVNDLTREDGRSDS